MSLLHLEVSMQQLRGHGNPEEIPGLNVFAELILCCVYKRLDSSHESNLSNLVGDIMMAPIWCFLIGSWSLSSFSTIGNRKARVFPLPVTASTTTSLFPAKRGIQLACTGVIRSKPILDIASRIHSDNDGVRPSQALVTSLCSGAICYVSKQIYCKHFE
jgi:hypothetical protein